MERDCLKEINFANSFHNEKTYVILNQLSDPSVWATVEIQQRNIFWHFYITSPEQELNHKCYCAK